MIKAWILTVTVVLGGLFHDGIFSASIIAPSKNECFKKAIYFKKEYHVTAAMCQEQWVPEGSYNAEEFNALRY